jgi:uncharacterized membrane protein YccC
MSFELLTLLRDRLIASDPGLARLLSAARVTLAVALSVSAIASGAAAFGYPLTFTILGGIVAMQASLAITDDDARATTLLAVFPGIAGIALGAFFADRGLLADVVFLVVLFAAVAVRSRGPRWTAFGTIAMMTYFVALFLGARIDALPVLIAAVIASILLAYVARFLLIPDRPAWIAARTVAVAAASVLDARDPAAARRHLTEATNRLNETAASIEGRLNEKATAELRVIFDAELAAEDLAAAAFALRDAAAPVPRALRLALTALTRGRTARAARVAERVTHDGGSTHPAARALAAAIVDLGETIVRVDSATQTLALSDGPWTGGGGAQQPALRQAIQVTVASTVAIVLGEALSPQRWYWAVLTTYFVFIGTASSGETFARAWSRIGGTALGVAAGVIVGHVVAGHPLIDLSALFACLFLGVYFLRVSYLIMMFFITAMLALLYVWLGRFSEGILAIRLIETAVGAICGGIAATVILPTRTRDVVRASATAALDAARTVVHASITRLVDPSPATPPPLDAARLLEESVQHFVARAKPTVSSPVLLGTGHELRRWIISLSACSHYGRLLARAADRAAIPLDEAAATQLRRIDSVIAANIDAAQQRVDGDHDGATTNTLALFDALRQALPADASAAPVVRSAAHLLERMDRTIARLARDEDTVTEIV